ncbi:MAG: kelch repeat-containing protein, partial [Gemmatimonadales bacterium]
LLRQGHTAVYDPDSNRLIVFGGESQSGLENYPVWVLTNANGTEPQEPAWFSVDYGCGVPCIAPPAVLDHTAIYDDVNNLMVTFGGTDYSWYFDEAHVYLNADAVEPSVSYFLPYYPGTTPNGRYGHTTIYDSASNIMTLYGGIMGIVLAPRGAGPLQVSDDPTFVWRLLEANNRNTAAWERIDTYGEDPPSRDAHTAVWDPASNRMIIFGGFEFFGGALLDDVWVLTKANGQL